MKHHIIFNIPLGPIEIIEHQGNITHLHFVDGSAVNEEAPTPLLGEAKRQVLLYMEGKLQQFTLPLCFEEGTPFQQKVWQALMTIPYGMTCSYQDIAKIIGSPKACRAVGGANNHNPIAIIVPCHRVIGANGKLVGYGGGLDKKEYLLKLEKAPKGEQN